MTWTWTWTRTIPTEPGYYWVRIVGTPGEPRMGTVYWHHDTAAKYQQPAKLVLEIVEGFWVYDLEDEVRQLSKLTKDYEFAGPLKPPDSNDTRL